MFEEKEEKIMEHAFKAFLKRILPDHYRQIQWENSREENIFAISGKAGHICIYAGDINTACRAVGEYLKYDAGVHLSWCGCRTELGETLPAPTPVRREIVQKYRVYMNYCTHSYSAAWWDWKRWEKEIDYMALNGVNMPLSVVGIEGVWYNTLEDVFKRAVFFSMAVDDEH